MKALARFPTKVPGRVSSAWGTRVHPVTKKTSHHNGCDFAVPTGTPLVAADDGVVSFVLVDSGQPAATTATPSGNAVGIKRGDGVSFSYSHMSRVDVVKGQRVKAGDTIGLSGGTGRSTGPHLHFVLRNAAGNDVDPAPFLPGANGGGGGGGGLGPLVALVVAVAVLA